MYTDLMNTGGNTFSHFSAQDEQTNCLGEREKKFQNSLPKRTSKSIV